MIDTKEAAARIVIAEFEARKLRNKADTRARRWRFTTALLRVVLALVLGVYLQVSHWQISGAQACGFFLIFLATSIWQEHQLRETIQTLQTELARLKNEREEKSA